MEQSIKIMGILNLSEDSFSDGVKKESQTAIEQALRLLAEGADVVDIGAESTRPGSTAVAAEAQIALLLPVLKGIRSQAPGAVISIDTRSASVAAECLKEGAAIINDVSALRHDPGMLPLLAKSSCRIVLMHMQGTPETMQADPRYDNVVEDVAQFFRERMAVCEAAGMERGRLILDPGFGFGKTLDHNLELLQNFASFRALGCPLLAGISRKGFLGTLSGEAIPAQRDRISAALGLDLALKGAAILRVHNVKMQVGALKVLRILQEDRPGALSP